MADKTDDTNPVGVPHVNDVGGAVSKDAAYRKQRDLRAVMLIGTMVQAGLAYRPTTAAASKSTDALRRWLGTLDDPVIERIEETVKALPVIA